VEPEGPPGLAPSVCFCPLSREGGTGGQRDRREEEGDEGEARGARKRGSERERGREGEGGMAGARNRAREEEKRQRVARKRGSCAELAPRRSSRREVTPRCRERRETQMLVCLSVFMHVCRCLFVCLFVRACVCVCRERLGMGPCPRTTDYQQIRIRLSTFSYSTSYKGVVARICLESAPDSVQLHPPTRPITVSTNCIIA
jgi:hypothetical protein